MTRLIFAVSAAGAFVFALIWGRPNSRTAQLINYDASEAQDFQGFTPTGRVIGDGMNVVDEWYAVYGDSVPRGKAPYPDRIRELGEVYLSDFPELSRIHSITLVPD